MQGNFKVGDFVVAPSLNSISLNGTTNRVEPKAMQVLACLAEHAGEVVGKEQLIQRVWADTHVTDDVLTVCISALRKAFNDSAREPFVIQTIPKSGYRLIAPVVRGNGNGAASPGGGPAAEIPRGEITGRVSGEVQHPEGNGLSLRWAIAASFMVVAGIAGYWLLSSRQTIDSLAIIPFVVTDSNPDIEGLSDGIAEGIIDGIAQLPKLRVMAWSTVTRYKGQKVDPMAVGRSLGVKAVLTGQVGQSGDDVVIQTELVDVQSGRQLWGQQYNRRLSDVVPLQAEIARQVSQKLRWRITGEEEKKIEKRNTTNPEAYQLYVKGRYFWNKRSEAGMKKAIEYFEQAIDKDPSYAVAYAGLADSYDLLDDWGKTPPRESFPKARAAALKALELDDSLAEAHTSLAFVKANYDWDFAGGEKEFKRAIELDPNYATAHQWYAMHLVVMKRFPEAEAEIRRAQELDPLSLIISMGVGEVFEWEGRHDLAVEQFKKTLDMDPNFAGAHGNLAASYERLGRYKEYLEELKKAAELDGDGKAVLAEMDRAYQQGGHRALTRLQLKQELEDLTKGRFVPAVAVADSYAALGNKEAALSWLEKGYQERDSSMVFLPVSTDFVPFHSEPAYQDLMRRLGLAEYGTGSAKGRDSSVYARN